MLTETITWVPVAERLPDDEITVLLFAPVQGGECWPGWRTGHAWRWADGQPVRCEVTHWADWPAGPPDVPRQIDGTFA